MTHASEQEAERAGSIRTTADRAAVVDESYHWIDARQVPPPRGCKLLCINRASGVACFGQWSDHHGWTHWAPLPTFRAAKVLP